MIVLCLSFVLCILRITVLNFLQCLSWRRISKDKRPEVICLWPTYSLQDANPSHFMLWSPFSKFSHFLLLMLSVSLYLSPQLLTYSSLCSCPGPPTITWLPRWVSRLSASDLLPTRHWLSPASLIHSLNNETVLRTLLNLHDLKIPLKF